MTHPILFAHSSDELYGSDVVLLELVRRLEPRRFRPIVVTPTDLPYEGHLSRALQTQGIRHQAMDIPVLRRRYFSPWRGAGFLRRLYSGPRQLRRLLDGEGVALVHSNTSAVWGGALAARRAGLPHVWHIHEIVTHPALVRRLIPSMVARYSDHVVAISQAVANHLLAGQPGLRDRLSVIHDAVDTDRFSPEIDGRALRETWGIRSDQVLVGLVGRVSGWKGQALFLDAFARAREGCPNLVAAIVGDVVPGEEWRREALRQQVERLGIAAHVVWAGFRDDSPEVMAAIDLLVQASTAPEPFGMVVVEAMAAGKPVVATAHGGPLETVRHGETGYLVSPTDPVEMSERIGALAADPGLRSRLGHAGRDRAVSAFGFAQHVARFQALYDELLSRPR